ncbi:TonB-dependent receptor [Caulobacter segnis]|uniref:TonB-dependent receptor n=2 Tax=Caulobacter segnis TaxID=88688 RepID=D5VNT8_CAUST|nr:TonB-dependent receptor [Caulobacter segnis]ADG12161.1 TonB-dependent receptor [Caulobacter segnis ATCC 21756]AVQ03762.1 TonB-dependent receptor [Caulobacter segnis]
MKSFHKSVLAASVSAMAVAAAAPALAQDSNAVEQVVVTGIRASLLQSIESKRRADAIIDVVTAEDVGKFPSANVAEALTIVPGVTVDRAFGQGEKVSILGTDPALNRTLLNGQTVASADWFILDSPGRTFNYALLAPQIVGKVDIYKSPEARIDEGSIGGTVIVNTRKPLDLKSGLIAGAVSYLYNDRSKKGDAQGSLLVSWKNADQTFGASFSVQRAEDQLRRDGVESYGTIAANQWAGGNPDNPVDSRTRGCTGTCASTLTSNLTARSPNAFGASYFEQDRTRTTYTTALQWKPTDALSFEFNWLKIKADYDNTNQSMYAFQGNTWNSLGALTGIEVNNGVVTKASFNNALSVLDVQYREAELNSDTYHLKGGYKGDGWDLNGEIGKSTADGGTKRQVFLEFLNWANYTVDISGAPKSAGSLTYTTNVMGNPAAFATDPGWSGNLVSKPTSDEEKYAQIDLGKDFDGVIQRVQVGYKRREHETGQQYAGIAITGVAAPASLFSPSEVPSNYLKGFDGVGDQMKNRFRISGPSMVDYVQSGKWLPTGGSLPKPSIFAAAEFTAGNWNIQEDIDAAYAQANFKADNIRGNFGVRYVKTSVNSAGYVCKPGAPCNAAADWTWQVTKKSYDNVLPSVNIIVDAREDLVFRFAAAQVIARPNYADMTNYFWLSDGILTGGGGNPALEPYKSSNFNASAEWYFQPQAILSAEVFYKDISNYILQRTQPESYFNQSQGKVTTYQISRPFNAGSAEVKGVALAYQQTYAYGFGLLANYTYADASGQDGAPLPYSSKNQVNVSPFYEHGPFSARATFTWRSKYFTGVDRGDNMFVRASKTLDVTAGYAVTKNITASVSAQNLLDSEYYAYANTTALPRGVYRTGRKLQATLNVSF